MSRNPAAPRDDRRWGSALIALGVALFVVVGVLAVAIIRDPGGHYDEWVPADDIDDPEASYEWTAAGLDVDFLDTTEIGTAPIERWRWDFDDGGTSAEPNPRHRFTDEGEWDVTLDVVDGNGRSSTAEGTVTVERGSAGSGDGSIGLADMADKVVSTVERASKGTLVVVLVIGSMLLLTLVGGRLVTGGVRLLRPDPEKIRVKLRPKELELAVADRSERRDDVVDPIEPSPPADDALAEPDREEVGVGA